MDDPEAAGVLRPTVTHKVVGSIREGDEAAMVPSSRAGSARWGAPHWLEPTMSLLVRGHDARWTQLVQPGDCHGTALLSVDQRESAVQH